MHPPSDPNPSRALQNTLHRQPVPYTRGFRCIPDSKSIPLATSPAMPCTSADPARAFRSQSPRAPPPPVTTWLRRACKQTNPRPVRMSHLPTERRQLPRASSPVVEFGSPLPVSHSQDQTSSSASVPFLFPTPAAEEYCAY